MARRVKRELDDFNANIESVRKIDRKNKSSLNCPSGMVIKPDPPKY